MERFSSLASRLRGRLFLPAAPEWDTARQAWKLHVDQRPAAIVAAEGAEDMAVTVSFAARHGLRVTAQCSGHGAGADLAGTIMVRTSALREITVDPAGNRVRVGAGVRCRDLAAAASPHSLAGSFGSGSTTGVVGYTMFGGAGALGRAVGFMADKLVAADVVTADGRSLRCHAGAHPDLLWALRGGSAGHALVTELELSLDRVPEIFGGQVVWPAAAAAAVLSAWRDWTAALPPEMTSSVDLTSLPPSPEVPEPLRGKRVTRLTACYAGPADRGASLIEELTRVARPLVNGCRPLVAADLASLWNGADTPMPTVIRSELLTSLPDAAINELIWLAGLDSGSPIIEAEVRHLGAAYAREPPGGPGAIDRPSANYLLKLVSMAPTPDAREAIWHQQHAVLAALARWTTGNTLPGFAEPPMDTAERVYSPATWGRLRRVKARYDPDGVLLPGISERGDLEGI